MAATPEQAAQIFTESFLRPFPATAHYERRQGYARTAYEAFSEGGAEPAAVTRGGPLLRAPGRPAVAISPNSPIAASWQIMRRGQEANMVARQQLADATKSFLDEKERQRPNADLLMDISETARLTGDMDLSAKVKNLSQAVDQIDQLVTQPIDVQE
jgi:hypothetical protein